MKNRASAALIFGLMICSSVYFSCASGGDKPADDQSGQGVDLNKDTGGGLGASGADAGLDAPPPGDQAGGAANEKSLFERIGGKDVLVKFCDKFVDAIAANPKMQANPKIMEGMKKDPAKQKAGMVEYLCQVSGGPCKYKGPSMKEAHQGLGVTADQWKVMGGIFIKTLRDMNVPKNERKELANLASMTKPDIVGQ